MATQTDLQLLSSKAADEAKALTLCRAKVIQKNLEMEITDAEWQFGACPLLLVVLRVLLESRSPQADAVLRCRQKD
jgi:cell fate regulator YaaT (PSP1 superfamily)